MRLRSREPDWRSVVVLPDFPRYRDLYAETAGSLAAAQIDVWWIERDGALWLVRRPGKGMLGGMRARIAGIGQQGGDRARLDGARRPWGLGHAHLLKSMVVECRLVRLATRRFGNLEK